MNPLLEGKKDTYNLIKNYDALLITLREKGTIFSRTNLIDILKKLQNTTSIKENLSLKRFLQFILVEANIVDEIQILMPDTHIARRYILLSEEISQYEIALSLLPGSCLSHYSALFIHDLTVNNPKNIYINREQSKKPIDKKNAILTQKKVDYAFSKPMRSTNNIAQFSFKGIDYKVFMLNGKNTNKLGVIEKKAVGFSLSVKTTDIERTLIDCIVRPGYAGGVEECMEAFKEAQNKIDLKKIVNYIKKLDYIYPIEQAVLFYLKRASDVMADLELLEELVESKNLDINYYLNYQMVNKTLDPNLKIYYPRDLGYYKLDVENMIAYVEVPDERLGVPVISTVEFYNKGRRVESKQINQIEKDLINIELHHQDDVTRDYYDEMRELFRNLFMIDISFVDIEIIYV